MSYKMNGQCNFEVQEVEDLEKLSHFADPCEKQNKKRKEKY